MRHSIFVVAALAATIPATPARADTRYTRDPVAIRVPTRTTTPARPGPGLPAATPLPRPDDPLAIAGAVTRIRADQIDLLDDMLADCAGAACDDDEVARLTFMKAE